MKICHSHLLWLTTPIQLLLMSTWFHTAGIQCRTMDIWFLNVDMAFLTTDVMVSPLSSYCLFYSLLLVHVVAVSGTMSVNLKNSSINTGVFSCLNRRQAPSEFYSVSSKSRGLNFFRFLCASALKMAAGLMFGPSFQAVHRSQIQVCPLIIQIKCRLVL